MDIKNECRIDFEYRLSLESPLIQKTISSNIVSTQVLEDILEVSKSVNKKETCSFDILVYTIEIRNISQLAITNLFFQDKIQERTRFIKNSVKVNNIIKRCANPESGFYIGNLASEDKVKIKFKVLVLPIHSFKYIKNYSTIEYDQIYNVEKPPCKLKKESNKVKIKYENRVFKSIEVLNTLETTSNIDAVLDSGFNVKIIETKLLNNYESDLYTLLIIGKIEYKMLYRCKCYSNLLEEVFGFSTFMLVPIGKSYCNKEELQVIIEYASTEIISANKVIANVSLLLMY